MSTLHTACSLWDDEGSGPELVVWGPQMKFCLGTITALAVHGKHWEGLWFDTQVPQWCLHVLIVLSRTVLDKTLCTDGCGIKDFQGFKITINKHTCV